MIGSADLYINHYLHLNTRQVDNLICYVNWVYPCIVYIYTIVNFNCM